MIKPKTHHDVKGWIDRCPNYQMCPLCYGCRAFNASYVKCLRCSEEDAKFNICNTELHTDNNLSKMILREVIDLDK